MSTLPAPRSSFPAYLVLACVVLAACGGDNTVKTQHDSVELSRAQQTVVTRLVGQWKHIGGDEQATAIAAVTSVTSEMNGLIRGMAQTRLEGAVKIDANLTFAEDQGIVTITRSDRSDPFVAPADGQAFDTVDDHGDDARGSLRVEGEALMTLVKTDKGGGERSYRVDEGGELEIVTRIFSPRLPSDVVYTCNYSRP